jgi:hypothetical protein
MNKSFNESIEGFNTTEKNRNNMKRKQIDVVDSQSINANNKRTKRLLLDVSDDIINYIIRFMPNETVLTFSCVNHRSLKLAQRPMVWTNRLIVLEKQQYPDDIIQNVFDKMHMTKFVFSQQGPFFLSKKLIDLSQTIRELSIVLTQSIWSDIFQQVRTQKDVVFPVLEKFSYFSKLNASHSSLFEWILPRALNLEYISYTIDSEPSNTLHDIPKIEQGILALKKLTYLELMNVNVSQEFMRNIFKSGIIETLKLTDYPQLNSNVFCELSTEPIAKSLRHLSIIMNENIEDEVERRGFVAQMHQLSLESLYLDTSGYMLSLLLPATASSLKHLGVIGFIPTLPSNITLSNITEISLSTNENVAIEVLLSTAKTLRTASFSVIGYEEQNSNYDDVPLNLKAIELSLSPKAVFDYIIRNNKTRNLQALTIDFSEISASIENTGSLETLTCEGINTLSVDSSLFKTLPEHLLPTIRLFELRSCDFMDVMNSIPRFTDMCFSYMSIEIDSALAHCDKFNYLNRSIDLVRIRIEDIETFLEHYQVNILGLYCLLHESRSNKIDFDIGAMVTRYQNLESDALSALTYGIDRIQGISEDSRVQLKKELTDKGLPEYLHVLISGIRLNELETLQLEDFDEE